MPRGTLQRLAVTIPLLGGILVALAPAPLAAVRPQQAAAGRAATVAPARPAGWIGVNFGVQETATDGRLTESRIEVLGIFEEGPAAAAGLRVGDRVVRVNGTPATWEVFHSVMSRMIPGLPVALTVDRPGESPREVSIRATARPDATELIPALVERELGSARTDFSGHLRQEGRSVPWAASRASGAILRLDSLTRPSVSGVLTRGASPQEAPAAFRLRMELPDPADGRPLVTWIRTDSLEALLRAREARLLAQESAGDALALLAGAEGEVVVRRLPDGSGAVEIRRPLAPYVTGLNRVAGAALQPMVPELAAYFRVEGGLLVTEVSEGTPAAEAGLEPGDVVLRVDDRPVTAVGELREAMVRVGTPRLTIVRRGDTLQIVLR